MANLIPDPTNVKAPAIVVEGDTTRLAPAVFMAPVGADPLDTATQTLVGYATSGFDVTYEDTE